jgi:hypothetical protein
VSDDHFLSRWSRLKREARKPAEEIQPPPPPEAALPATAAAQATPAAEAEPVPLPPIESLTPESDFTPFMQANVDPATRTQALKALFKDPQFNVMDGLDTYIADYSIEDPLPPGWLEKMHQFSRLGDFAAREAERLAQLEEPETPAEPPDSSLNAKELPRDADGAPPEGDSPPPIEGIPTRAG